MAQGQLATIPLKMRSFILHAETAFDIYLPPIYKLTSVFTQINQINGWVVVLGWQTERDLALQTSKDPEEGEANMPVLIHKIQVTVQTSE